MKIRESKYQTRRYLGRLKSDYFYARRLFSCIAVRRRHVKFGYNLHPVSLTLHGQAPHFLHWKGKIQPCQTETCHYRFARGRPAHGRPRTCPLKLIPCQGQVIERPVPGRSQAVACGSVSHLPGAGPCKGPAPGRPPNYYPRLGANIKLAPSRGLFILAESTLN